MSNVLTFRAMVPAQNKLGFERNKSEKRKKRYVSHPHTGGKKSTLDHSITESLPSDEFTEGLLHGQTEVLIGGHHTNGVGVAHTATPSLDTDDRVTLVDDSELETVVDTPLEATVDIFLPDLDVEIRLGLGEVERPHTAVQVGVLELLSAKNDTIRTIQFDLPGQRCHCE